MLLLLMVGLAGASNCSREEMLACAHPSHVEQGIRFAMSEEDLAANCPHLDAGLRCIDDYTRACLSPAQRSVFYRSYVSSGMVLQEICSPGPYREQFLRLAPCVNNVTEEYRACGERYERALRRLKKGPEICAELERLVACSEAVVRKVCGHESADFTAGFLSRMTESLILEHCPKVTDSALQPTPVLLLPLLAALLLRLA